ncbi:PilW family protein [Acinetobacter sp.]|uniref:PilW family protein n=1 Tax=Acinetobacter sp. TaxID=472 RepID=UPI002647F19E|nr:PilW family protein [Acinetobacter sp.]MDN5511403.1 PilW family protein [Acinetobacter sp.]MDN5524055.1 PilW family protein [Acinetobacter sp.]
MKTLSYSGIKVQKGFTLVELMVALILGLLISAAAVQLFLGGLLGSRMQDANAELQNSGVFGLDYVARDIRLANYINTTNPNLNEQTPWGGVVLTARDATTANANIPIPAAAPFISKGLLSHSVGTDEAISSVANEWQGLSNVNKSSDQLTIQFVAPNDMFNCEGDRVFAGDYVIQRYFLRRDPATATTGTNYGLACDTNTPATTAASVNSQPSTISGFGGAGELIMPRVDHFTVQLGTRNAAGNMAYYTINQYRILAKNARAAATPTVPPRIVSVKLAVLVRSMDNTRNESIDLTKTFNILNQSESDSVSVNDQTTKFARRVYSTVVTFRNGLGE